MTRPPFPVKEAPKFTSRHRELEHAVLDAALAFQAARDLPLASLRRAADVRHTEYELLFATRLLARAEAAVSHD